MPERNVYLDHNATGPVHPEVRAAVLPHLAADFGNPSAPYPLGQSTRQALDRARAQLAGLLGGAAGDVVFTGGGTEANNLAISGAFFGRAEARRRHLVVSAIEHPSVRETCAWLAARHGAEVTVLGVGADGRVRLDELSACLRPETLLVAVMHANNETGVLQPVAEIGCLLQPLGVRFHIDGVQAAGRIPVDVEALGCHSYAVSGHKFGGMKGAGALILRDREGVDAILRGGHQEGGWRAGTENVPGLVALGAAAAVAARDLARNQAHALRLRTVFDGLANRIPQCWRNGHPDLRLPNTTSLCCFNADAMSVVLALASLGISVGTGSACASHSQEPSGALLAMGLDDHAAFCTIRVSTGPDTTLEDAEWAADRIEQIVERVRLVTSPEDIGGCGADCPCFAKTSS
ncbi:MAG: cysteine desulfurase family protein [Lentisphaeria bacterium]|jgi:cysteine desulfurase|nr:cysteine desulfurase family protein [Lentisphaeria bacterium]